MHTIKRKVNFISKEEYKREMQRAQLGDNIARHMAFIFSIILYDKFDFTQKKLDNCEEKIIAKRLAWQDDDNEEVTSNSLLTYCEKRNLHIVKFVKDIPMSRKLFLSDVKKGKAVIGADVNIESAMLATLFLVIPILKESYKFSNAKIQEFLNWVDFYIDSYCRKQPGCKDYYCSDELIRQIFLEEQGIDLFTGKKVEVA